MSEPTMQVNDASVCYTVTAEAPDVPAGYKRTEVGVIPEDWEVKSVQEIGRVKTGPFGTLLKAREYSSTEGVPLISVGEIGPGFFRISESTPLVPFVVRKRLPQYVLRVGDIVFGRKGAVNRSAMVTAKQDGWFLGSDGIAIRPQGLCSASYLSWQFQREEVQTWLLQNSIGTTMPSMNHGILTRVQIPIATVVEQQAIAEALSDVDRLLGALKSLIAKKRAIKQAAMQQLLTGKTRLPGFSGEWETKRLGDIAHLYQPVTISARHFGESGYPVYGANGIIGFYREFNHETRQVAVTCRGSTCGAVNFTVEQSWITGNAMVVNCDDNKDVVKELVYYVLVASDLSVCITGTGQPQIVRQPLANLELNIAPSVQEQEAIATVLSDMDAEILALERRRDKTRAIKQGMMQQLLTGKIRLV